MKQEQIFVTSTDTRKESSQQNLLHRILPGILIGVCLTLILTLLELCMTWLFSPLHILSNVFAIPVQHPLWLLLPAGELVAASIAATLATKPVALMAYLRDVHSAQEEYHKLYTPLTALANIRRTAEVTQDDVTAPTIYMREEQVSILDLVRQQDTHLLILGVPGAGKTTALRVFQYNASQNALTLVMKHGRIPIYVPMKNYSLFLKKWQPTGLTEDAEAQSTLLDYLYESDLPGLRHLRPYLGQLSEAGQLLLLCDGLNEIDNNYVTRVSEELVNWMRHSRNRLVMTCREVDYREQREFVELVDEGQAARAVIYPLLTEQISEFVERYVEGQDKTWKHTAGQIMQVIDRSRLRYHCTNPMMLFTLMGIIDKIGVERGKQIDTRGRLLRESVRQLIAREQGQARWNREAPAEKDMIRFLSEVACAARWANDRNAIQLRVSPAALAPGDAAHGNAGMEELADELQFWLDEHPAKGPFAIEDEVAAAAYDNLPQLLQFALSTALIEVSSSGVLSFRHELIAEYFVAEYFFAASKQKQDAPIREELTDNVGRWSEPVAIWAGLLRDPLELAERFGALGLENPSYILQALTLGLVCVGVLWTPPQAEIQRPVLLPPSLEEALSMAVRNRAAREELARIFTRSAEEGGQEVYRSLLPLIMVDGVDDLLTLLDQTIVPEVLFTHLQDAVDNVAYEVQVKRITRVLGRFGGVVVERALQLSLPAPERSPRMRAAAINILGGTGDPRAVEPLMARLSDAEQPIVERATNALIRLGPTLTLTRVLQELENRTQTAFTQRIHLATLLILGRFMDEPDSRRQLSLMQYQRILETMVPILTSNYQAEPEAQQQARAILVRQGRNTKGVGARDQRWDKVIEALVRYLPSQNDVAVQNVMQVLQEIGTPATPRLLEMLTHPSEVVRVRVIAILKTVHDPRALPQLLHLVADAALSVQQEIASALQQYAPESISGLIDLTLTDPAEPVAQHAAHILGIIGERVVEPVVAALTPVVPGRTRLLVQVLEEVHDARCVSALIALLQTALEQQPGEPLLIIAIIRALSQFPDIRVVSPLLSVLSTTYPQIYEEAITALSLLGEVALSGLVAALDAQQEPAITQRLRRAILGMTPFPGDLLIEALTESSAMRAEQIMLIFKMQGPEAAQVLVRHLLHKDEHIRGYIQQTLNAMPGALVVPALLEVLNQPALRKIASAFLLKYPDAAISPLVELLGEHERGDIAAMILPQFGPMILRSLISALDDQRSMAREAAQHILVTLVQQSEDNATILHEIIHLFNPTPPERAREELISVLTNELADSSLPALLEGLEDAHLIDDVAEALVRLFHKPHMQVEQHNIVLERLLEALFIDERRRGAETALILIGAPAVPRLGEMITHQNQAVARATKQILREIGVPALPFIWNAHSDNAHPARREAALEIFHSMRTEVIKDELIARLTSHTTEDISMAVTLLVERIHDEAVQHYADRIMVPELLDYVQTHDAEATNLRVIALLLLLGEQTIIDHLIQALDENPEHRKQLAYTLLLMGTKTQQLLLDVFNDAETTVELRSDLAAILGMSGTPEVIGEQARNLSKYGLSSNRTSVLFPDQLTISHRALGGLLAGGHWNAHRIQEMRDACKEDDPARELFNVLLGWRYEPQIVKLENDLKAEREAHTQEVVKLTARIATDQQRIRNLDEELEKIREAHGTRGEELQQTKKDNEALHTNVEQLTKERVNLNSRVEQLTREKSNLNALLDRAKLEMQALQKQQDALKQQGNQPQTR